MEQLTFFEKLGVLFSNIIAHPLFIVILLIPVLMFALNKKFSNKIIIVIYLAILSVVLFVGNATLFELFDNMMDSLFMSLYFPSFVTLFMVVVLSAAIALTAFVRKNTDKMNKVIHITGFALIQTLFCLILSVVQSNDIDIYAENALYSNNDVLTLMQLLMGAFAVQLAALVIIYAIDKVTDYLEHSDKKQPVSSEKTWNIQEQIEKLKATKLSEKTKQLEPIAPIKKETSKTKETNLVDELENTFVMPRVSGIPSEKNKDKQKTFIDPIKTKGQPTDKVVNKKAKDKKEVKEKITDKKMKSTVSSPDIFNAPPSKEKPKAFIDSIKPKEATEFHDKLEDTIEIPSIFDKAPIELKEKPPILEKPKPLKPDLFKPMEEDKYTKKPEPIIEPVKPEIKLPEIKEEVLLVKEVKQPEPIIEPIKPEIKLPEIKEEVLVVKEAKQPEPELMPIKPEIKLPEIKEEVLVVKEVKQPEPIIEPIKPEIKLPEIKDEALVVKEVKQPEPISPLVKIPQQEETPKINPIQIDKTIDEYIKDIASAAEPAIDEKPVYDVEEDLEIDNLVILVTMEQFKLMSKTKVNKEVKLKVIYDIGEIHIDNLVIVNFDKTIDSIKNLKRLYTL